MESRKKLSLKVSTILIGLLCFLMILPDDVFGWVSLYKSLTPSSISYIWLNYDFGIIQLFILLVGLYYAIKLNKKWFFALLIVMFFREVVYFILNPNNIFSASAYEMYLALLVGYAFVLWAEGGLKTREECERFFKWFLVSNMLTLYINYIMGGTGGMLAGRYHSSNLDAGGTGTVCVLCILFLTFSSEKQWYDYFFIVLSAIGLLLSGSRANLVFLLLILGFYLLANTFRRFKNENEQLKKNQFLKRFVVITLAFLSVIVVGIVYSSAIEAWLLNSRFVSLFNTQGLRSDDSILGRSASLTAGLDVIKTHPLGISGYFINLQQEVRMRGYPTFPHSTLLSMYLLFGPVVLLLYGMWIGMLKKLRNIGAKYYIIIAYLLVSTIIYGGPVANFKIAFMLVMVSLLARWAIRDQDIIENTESSIEQQG